VQRNANSNRRILLPIARCATVLLDGRAAGLEAVTKPNTGFDYDRYRKLLAEADDEPKRLAFINLLIDEKARDQLARQSLRSTLAGMGLTTKPGAD
jgi:hypothetical protein